MKHGLFIIAFFIYGLSSDPAARCEVPGENTPIYIKAVYSPPLTLDPIKMVDTASLVAGNMIYDGLLEFSPFLETRGELAESWTTSLDGRVLTFKLRHGAQFHDGSPVTAQDVVFSLSRALGPGSPVYKYYDCILGADDYFHGRVKTVKGLRALSGDTVEIKLKYAFPPFLSVLAGGTAKILPASKALRPGFFDAPVGSGAFRFVEIIKKDGATDTILEKFPEYYGEVPHISKMILRSVEEAAARDQAMHGKIYDLANWPLSGNEEVFKNGTDAASPVAATWIIGLNTRLAPFNDLNIRNAFRAAAPVEKFRETFYPDAFPAWGYIPKGIVGYREDEASISTSPIIKPPSKKIKIAFPKELAKEKEMRALFETTMKRKGWNVEFVATDWASVMKGYEDKTLQGFVMSMNMDYPDPEFLVRNFESTNPDNFSGINDKKLDNLIHRARQTQDRVERKEIYSQINQRLDDVSVTVNIFHPRAHYWINKCVRGFEPNILSDYYIDYRKVWLDQKCLKDAGG